MRRTAKACLGAWIGLTMFAIDTQAWDQPQVNWQQDHKKGIAEAQNLSRPVLLYFTAKWCPSCLRVERTVFVDKRVVQFIGEHFVAVRIDADAAPDIAAAWKVDRLPSAIFASPDGRTQNRIEGYRSAEQFLSELCAFVKTVQSDASNAQQPSEVRPADHASANPQSRPALDEQIELASRSVHQPTARVAGPGVLLSLLEEPDLAFDGTCVVSMLDSRKFTSGDPQYSASMNGATYWFAGSQELEKFQADPQRYIPMANGLCVASLVDEGDKVWGSTHWAAIYRDRLFLFASAELRRRFQVDAKRYYDSIMDRTNK
jgi:thioredoxin-related protein/YHS domain-containing protein